MKQRTLRGRRRRGQTEEKISWEQGTPADSEFESPDAVRTPRPGVSCPASARRGSASLGSSIPDTSNGPPPPSRPLRGALAIQKDIHPTRPFISFSSVRPKWKRLETTSLPRTQDIPVRGARNDVWMHAPTETRTFICSYTQKQLYELVADASSYPRFLPFCTSARVLNKQPHPSDPHGRLHMDVELTVGFMSFTESYVSKVTCRPYESVEVSSEENYTSLMLT